MSEAERSSEQSNLLTVGGGEVGSGSDKEESVESEETNKKTFSGIGLVLSCLGSVVGTGNIWRYPRIVAIHATGGGALVFLIVWFGFLWLWSIPLIILEYATGRFTKFGTVESMNKLAGPAFRFLGAWLFVIPTGIGCYYCVIVGWCVYYTIHYVFNDLPSNVDESFVTWNELQDSQWPIWCHLFSVLFGALAVSRGVSTIEPLSKVVVPVLLGIVVFSFYWSLFLPYAHIGIQSFFTPNWSSLTNSKMWLDAITQNAWDTGAAGCAFLTYATYMKRTNGAVRNGVLIPISNNFVSLLCGLLVFNSVFSVLIRQSYSSERILDIIADNGPANTGLTFIWMPLLYNNITGGRFLCVVFFLCVALAGLSSVVSLMERPIHVLSDFGIRRIPATILIGTVVFFIGLASAIDLDVLVNQDTVWGYALLVSGLACVFMVVRYGGEKFRTEVVNKYGIGDWKLPRLWTLVIYVLSPLQAIGILLWYIIREIVENEDETWYKYSRGSLIMVLTQWAFTILILIGLNWWMQPLQYHPKDPNLCSHRILKFLIKSPTTEPTPAHQLTHELTPDSTENESSSMVEYYQVSRSIGATTDENMYASTDDDTKL